MTDTHTAEDLIIIVRVTTTADDFQQQHAAMKDDAARFGEDFESLEDYIKECVSQYPPEITEGLKAAGFHRIELLAVDLVSRA